MLTGKLTTMQKEQFREYLHNPGSFKNASLSELEELTREFPWFSSAAIIFLHCSNIQNDPDFSSLLKKLSIHIPNRKVLHTLIQSAAPPPRENNDPIMEDSESEVLHSRIQGIFDPPLNESYVNDIQSLNPVKSVLEDESLLDFSYSGQKAEFANPERKDTGIDRPVVTQNEELSDEEKLKVIPEEKEKNFDHWISKLSSETETEDNSFKKYEIIESFISSDPGVIRADKETWLHGDVSKGSAEENEGFITDTLAKIYVKQGLYNKAIYAYEKLCLKYPEKSIYFVTQIEEIKRLYIKK